MELAIIVLAGGKIEESLKDYSALSKAFIKIGGKYMLEYILEILKDYSR
ncbi:MAG: hypothetical protein HYU63_05600, partial [Armatimonadetes bacterium]|nr:hypothetical protein [Armatimonadota bacterium]